MVPLWNGAPAEWRPCGMAPHVEWCPCGMGLSPQVGGSADLTPSNLTKFRGALDFQSSTPEGRYIRFGVREHAMAGARRAEHIVPYCAHTAPTQPTRVTLASLAMSCIMCVVGG